MSKEATLRRFWIVETLEEIHAVDRILRRRFSTEYAVIDGCLDTIDPLHIVYPGNQGEYRDVVREVIVLMATKEGVLRVATTADLSMVLLEAFARCFDDLPDSEAIDQLAHCLVRMWEQQVGVPIVGNR